MTYYFFELFIFFLLTLDIYCNHTKEILYVNTKLMGNHAWINLRYLVLPHQRNTACENKLNGKPIMK